MFPGPVWFLQFQWTLLGWNFGPNPPASVRMPAEIQTGETQFPEPHHESPFATGQKAKNSLVWFVGPFGSGVCSGMPMAETAHAVDRIPLCGCVKMQASG